MQTPSTKKCAHPSCACKVEAPEEFCSDECRTAVETPGSKVEEQCQCGHSDCIVGQAEERLDRRDRR